MVQAIPAWLLVAAGKRRQRRSRRPGSLAIFAAIRRAWSKGRELSRGKIC